MASHIVTSGTTRVHKAPICPTSRKAQKEPYPVFNPRIKPVVTQDLGKLVIYPDSHEKTLYV